MLPEVAAFKVCLFRTADADCEYIVIIPRTLGIALNAVELAEDFWMGRVFDHALLDLIEPLYLDLELLYTGYTSSRPFLSRAAFTVPYSTTHPAGMQRV